MSKENIKQDISIKKTTSINTKQEFDLEKNKEVKNIDLSKNKILKTNISDKKISTTDIQEDTATMKKTSITQEILLQDKNTNKKTSTQKSNILKIKKNNINIKEINYVQQTKQTSLEEVNLIRETNVNIKSKDIKQKINLTNQDNKIPDKKDLNLTKTLDTQTPLINKIKKEINVKTINEENITKTSLVKDDIISTKYQELVQEVTNNSKITQKEINKPLSETSNLKTQKNNQQVEKQTKQVSNDNMNKEQKNTTITNKTINSFNELEQDNISTNKININKKDILNKIYLSKQNYSINNQVLKNKNLQDKLVKNITSSDDIKESAKIMNLNLQDIKVDIKTYEHKQNLQDNLLNKIILNKNIIKKQIQENINNTNENTKISSSKNNSVENEKIVNLNISPSLALSIQSKIIGAKQGMSSMMSELAKKMYTNYKAPLTSFRINLFPSQMGSIAIMMKNDKDSGISISMNMSNTSTLDAFIENQQSLKDSLNKTFNNNTSFNLDFNMNKQNSSNTNDHTKKEEKETLSNEALSSTNIIDDEIDTLNYM